MAKPDTRSRAIVPFVIAAYFVVALGAVGLEIRPPHDAPLVETTLTRISSFLWAAGALVAIPTAWRGHWLEKVGTSAILGGTVIALADAVLLDVLPSWPPLSRPVLTITALVVAALFFATRLADLRHERPHLPAEAAVERADRLRGMPA